MNLDMWFDKAIAKEENVFWSLNEHIHNDDRGLIYVGAESNFNRRSNLYIIPDYQSIYSTSASKLMLNSCLHRQMPLLIGDSHGIVKSFSCPAHAWKYDTAGNCTHTPHMDVSGCDSKLPFLLTTKTNGLVLAGDVSDTWSDLLAKSRIGHLLNFEGLEKHYEFTAEYNFNWKTFLEVYLELYHVKPVHPGLGGFVDTNNFEWEFGNNWSCQIMGLSHTPNRNSGHWKKYQELVLSDPALVEQNIGTIWTLLYPNIMVEWYPHMLVISTIRPKFDDPTKCINKVEMFSNHPNFMVLQLLMMAYNEAAEEDQWICEGIDRARKQLWYCGQRHVPFNCAPSYEDGIPHFYSWLTRRT